MLIFVVFTSCLLYPLTSGQVVINAQYPTIGPIYSVPNNNSVLNFTFIYPNNYQFAHLYVRFTVYDFIGNATTNPQPYRFSWQNFTDSNFSLPWVVPPIILVSGDYIIACFEWVQTDSNDELVSDTYRCVLTRTALNNTILPIANATTSIVVQTNTTAMISGYFPRVLPYDQVTISSTINQTILPSMSNSTSNNTYSSMNTFMFTNLTPNTCYNLCVFFNYANSIVNGSQNINSQCQTFVTLGGGISTTPGVISTTPGVIWTTPGVIWTTPGVISTTPGVISTTPGRATTTPNTSNIILPNMLIMILLFIFVLI